MLFTSDIIPVIIKMLFSFVTKCSKVWSVQPRNKLLSQKLLSYALAYNYEFLAPVPEIKVPIFWVLGGPGSGKGTQCERIVAKYGFTHLSSGDLLREEVNSGTSRGQELTAIMERGELVPMEVVLEMLKEAIIKNLPNSNGFLIDGYPREKEQGIMFEQTIAPVTAVLFFDASEETLTNRLLGRAQTSGRADDNIDTIRKRLITFKTHNEPIVQQYNNKLKKINAERDVDQIFTEVEQVIDGMVGEDVCKAQATA